MKVYEKVKEQELDFQRKNGSKIQLLFSISLMYSEFGDILGLIVNVQDITELKKLEAQAERKNRFTVMGEMAATIAHEIRNPLGSIELFASLLKKDLPADSSKQALLSHITSAIHSMNHIISNILEYTKPHLAFTKDIIEIHQFLYDVLDVSQYLAKPNHVQICEKFEAIETYVAGDKELLKQVFFNLMNNAVQAILESGSVTVSTRNIHANNEKLLRRFREFLGPAESLHLIEIRIQDTGLGMSPEVKKKIFDPFFTTKERGTGLGLAIVHNIVEAHNALIDVESEVDQGTQFTLLFPVLSENDVT